MSDIHSRPPAQVRVVVNSGEANSQTFKAKLLGVDLARDLAALRIEGDGLPEPLKIGTAGELVETQQVFIFGFPYGDQLGRNITVSHSTVSSLRKTNGEITEVQLNGGMHPGNSGGPVVDSRGRVVGMSVSIIAGTQINFAVPGDRIQAFFAGRVAGLSVDLAYRDGDTLRLPVRVRTVDPLGHVKNVRVLTWMAPRGTRRRPGAASEPAAQPDDVPIGTMALDYDGHLYARADITLPPLPEGDLTYWFRPIAEIGGGQTQWSFAAGGLRPNPVDRRAIELHYRPEAGARPPVFLTSLSRFRLSSKGLKPKSIGLNLKLILEPTVAEPDAVGIRRVHYHCKQLSSGVVLDGKLQPSTSEIRESMRNAVRMTADVEMDPDGSHGAATLNMNRVATAQRLAVHEIGEQIVQSLALLSVPTPNGQLRPMQIFRTRHKMGIGTLSFEAPAEIEMRCQYLGTRTASSGEPCAATR